MERELAKPSTIEFAQLAAETLSVFGIEDPYEWWGNPNALGAAVQRQLMVDGSLLALPQMRMQALKKANKLYVASAMALALVRLTALDLIHTKEVTQVWVEA